MKIGIAGAGIMGRLLAFKLLEAGHNISLYDQDEMSGNASCSMAAAGMLAPVSELEKCGQAIYELGMHALNVHWPEIIKKLDHEIYFKKRGSLLVSHPKDEAELSHFISMIESKFGGLSTKECANPPYNVLKQNELAELEPALSKFQHACYLPFEGQLDNQALMNALRHYLLDKIEWLENTKVISIENQTIRSAACGLNECKTFDLVFDCRGLGATGKFNDLQAVRGELIWLHAPDVQLSRPVRFMHPRYSLYIVPRPNNIYLMGASEIYAEDYSPISVRSCLELLTAAYYLHPAFAEARMIKTVTHCRPALPDHLPKVKISKDSIAVNGLYRHGYLIAPAIAAEIIRYMNEGENHDHDLFEHE